MKTENDKLIALANMLITNLPKEHNDIIDRWCSAVADGVSAKEVELLEAEYADFNYAIGREDRKAKLLEIVDSERAGHVVQAVGVLK